MVDAPDRLRRPRQLSEIVDGAISLYRQNFLDFVAIAAITLPVDAVSAIVSASISDAVVATLAALPFALVSAVLTAVAVAAIAGAIDELPGGVRADFNRAYRKVLDRLGALLGAAVRVMVVTLLLGVTIVGIPFAAYFGVRWAFFPQTVMLEGRGTGEALSRSAAIVQGSWWRTFGILIVISLLQSIPAVAVTMLFGWATPAAGALASAVVAVLALPFLAGATTLLYFDLATREKEHVSPA